MKSLTCYRGRHVYQHVCYRPLGLICKGNRAYSRNTSTRDIPSLWLQHTSVATTVLQYTLLMKHVFDMSTDHRSDWKRRLHSPMLLSVKRCDNASHSSTIAFFGVSWIKMADTLNTCFTISSLLWLQIVRWSIKIQHHFLCKLGLSIIFAARCYG